VFERLPCLRKGIHKVLHHAHSLRPLSGKKDRRRRLRTRLPPISTRNTAQRQARMKKTYRLEPGLLPLWAPWPCASKQNAELWSQDHLMADVDRGLRSWNGEKIGRSHGAPGGGRLQPRRKRRRFYWVVASRELDLWRGHGSLTFGMPLAYAEMV
jgi:hypothetical protein